MYKYIDIHAQPANWKKQLTCTNPMLLLQHNHEHTIEEVFLRYFFPGIIKAHIAIDSHFVRLTLRKMFASGHMIWKENVFMWNISDHNIGHVANRYQTFLRKENIGVTGKERTE